MEINKKNREKILVISKRVLLFLVDSIICASAGLIAGAIMLGGETFEYFQKFSTIWRPTFIGIGIQFVAMELLGGYKHIVKYSDVYYNVRLIFISILSFITQLLILGGMLSDYLTASTFSFLQTMATFAGIIISRFIYQFVSVDRKHMFSVKLRHQHLEVAKRVMIIGAGWTGKRVLASLIRAEEYNPVCFVDDDESKQNMIMDNIPIVGKLDSIQKNVEKYKIDKIIIAIPSANIENKRIIISDCLATGKEVNIVPNIAELVANADFSTLLRNVKIEDLLQRDEIEFDTTEISEFIVGRVCLVTGGGGSIGSELCRQISSFSPKKLIIADIYENGAFDLASELKTKYGEALDLQLEIISVTDEEALDILFKQEKIDLIFHAAAHKHVPLMEHNPPEAVKNNICGTWNVAKLAAKHKVKKMILVSTDKAVNPTNVMGATKRFCEKILGYYSTQTKDTTYAMVRFGNVLGSNGSVFHIFNKQIERGGPVRVTHKDIIRYFMTIPEAVSLILQSAVYADGGEVFVLDMGKPIKIVSLAENMIRLAGHEPYKDIDIVFTGLRPGEKLFEEILMSEEGMKKTANNKIYIGNQSYIADPSLSEVYEKLMQVAMENDKESTVVTLQQAVETYTPDARYYSASGVQSVVDNLKKSNNKKEVVA